jgi:hypothetical protein
MGRKVRSLLGRRFGRLQVVEFEGTKHAAYWLCNCDCGQSKLVRSDHLLSGRVVSCGCRRADSDVRQRATLSIPKKNRTKRARAAVRVRWRRYRTNVKAKVAQKLKEDLK